MSASKKKLTIRVVSAVLAGAFVALRGCPLNIAMGEHAHGDAAVVAAPGR